jgi:hypothetical protein
VDRLEHAALAGADPADFLAISLGAMSRHTSGKTASWRVSPPEHCASSLAQRLAFEPAPLLRRPSIGTHDRLPRCGLKPAPGANRVMYTALQILTVMLAAVTMSMTLAHALELPGKMRLDKEQYLAVQAIYYPGFTLGGIAEVAGIIAAATLLIMTPWASPQFWLVGGAVAALVLVQVIFWTMTQPVNKYWLQSTELSRVATRFFDTGTAAPAGDWKDMRDRWERSHVLRAIASLLGLLLVTVAVAL